MLSCLSAITEVLQLLAALHPADKRHRHTSCGQIIPDWADQLSVTAASQFLTLILEVTWDVFALNRVCLCIMMVTYIPCLLPNITKFGFRAAGLI